MNIYDIAKKAGVSSATVSRVINGSDTVSPRSRAKVEKVMEQEGFIPNIFARGLNLNSIQTIGVICPVVRDINHAYPVHIIEGLLRENGFDCLLSCTNSNSENKEKYLNILHNKRVDAIIVIGSTPEERENPEVYKKIAAHIPVMIVNGLVEAENVYCVLSDEYSIVYDCVSRWCDLGLRDIVYIYDSDTFSGYQKRTGYLDALRDHGITPDPRRILRAQEGNEPGVALNSTAHQMRELLEQEVNVDAVLSADDILAVSAQKVLLERGASIPTIGFNDSMYARCATPELTSVNIKVRTLCSTAVNTLLQVLNKEEAASKIVISCELVQRDSCRFGEPSVPGRT